ncbi:hypothetical protein [Tsuneonella amylolytica]|uniref:hypothetical protein n=1 Tax=Tsuneonella amylolytica TaxID=2338327 RepID=UPI000EAA9B3B|nr:hypothetical protein [Tsuneonella amylolytica]
MAFESNLVAAILAGVAAVVVLRSSWQRRKRSAILNVAGWSLGVLAIALGWQAAGAWGATIVTLWAMGAAYAVLSIAAISAPAAKVKASNRRAGMLPEQGEPLRLGRRSATFFIVGAGALLGAIAIAVATRWLASATGADAANATVLALFAAPLAYTLLAFFMLMTTSRRAQFGWIGASIASAVPAILMGSAL